MGNSEHIEHFQATAVGGGWPTAVNIPGTQWSFQVDEPNEDDGSNSGPSSMRHFVRPLARCQVIYGLGSDVQALLYQVLGSPHKNLDIIFKK